MPSPWVLVVVLLVHLAQCEEGNELLTFDSSEIYEPSWVYKCVPDEGCQRMNRPRENLAVNTSMLYNSLSVCRTVCGRFGGLWPRPVIAAISSQTVRIHPNFIRFDLIDAPASTRSLLVKMTQVVTKNLVAECLGNVTGMTHVPVVVYITVMSEGTTLSWDTNEQYMLDVQTKGKNVLVHVVAETVFGARHALETFSQLVAPEMPDDTEHFECYLHVVAGAKIRDRPVYRHRGLVLDTARNFIPMPNIKKMIDGMAATKMNVFHWHVTDTQSFPLESSRVPQFTRYGAYSALEIYSAEEVRELVEYALVRGVRLVIEIDSPAHAGNGWQWGPDYGLGNLAVCVNAKAWRKMCVQPPCGQLNPANQQVYTVLRNLYRDILDLVPRPTLLHMGGDEVFINCWNQTEEVVAYMKNQSFPTTTEGFMELWAEFHKKALKTWDEEQTTAGAPNLEPVMLWSSELTQPQIISKHLDPTRYVIEVWEPTESFLLNDLLRLGYRAISVPKNIWYLDHGFWGETKYSNWRLMYSHRLPEATNMLGGEVAMWSEYIDNQALDTRVWPRAAAVGERLWANPTSGSNAAAPRLQRHRERLLSRGIRVDVLTPGWCAQHDSKCI